MADAACPACRGNLYTASSDGFSCLGCGYEEAFSRASTMRYSQPIPLSDRDRVAKEQRLREEQIERGLDQEMLLFQVDWDEAFAERLADSLSCAQRIMLNRAYKKAEDLVTRYEAMGGRQHLRIADTLIKSAKRMRAKAKNAVLLDTLDQKISSYLKR